MAAYHIRYKARLVGVGHRCRSKQFSQAYKSPDKKLSIRLFDGWVNTRGPPAAEIAESPAILAYLYEPDGWSSDMINDDEFVVQR